jgi:hypothetical protein
MISVAFLRDGRPLLSIPFRSQSRRNVLQLSPDLPDEVFQLPGVHTNSKGFNIRKLVRYSWRTDITAVYAMSSAFLPPVIDR